MKKLIVLMTAIVAAFMTQAAMVNWTASSLTDYKSGTFYLFDSSKQADVLAALAAVDDSTATKLDDMAITSGSVSTKGKASAASTDVGSTTEVLAVVFAGTEFADGVSYKYMVEDISTMVYTPPAGAPGNFNSTIATAGTTGTMQGGVAPEPTSGLLLLVGGAMLALRRKQK